jgi:AAA15 family ATPase/GTPase
MQIKKIKISNFRSIVKLEITIDKNNNFICFCGANNVGKTNILNALSLFFGKSEYDPEKDCPNHKYYGTRGGHYQPKIEIIFSANKDIYQITRDWNVNKDEFSGKKNNTKLSTKDASDFINKIYFFYLPSINMSFPDAIKYIMNSDIIDLETGKTRMSGKKGEMKNAIEKVLSDLKSILDSLGENISPLLDKYKEGWAVAFDISSEVNSFRDLMIGEIDFYIKDKSNSKAIDAKGAGLQRLCHILMYFRIIEKLNEKKQKVILCIDEPNVYLHSGLQKKLLQDIKEISSKNQIFITTHSSIFIDTIKLSNVFLLDQHIEEKQYQRAKRKTEDKKFNAIETRLVDFNDANGISTLKEYLGIEDKDNLLFDKYNLLVEGEEDKIYFSKLMKHFGISLPNIIACNGADNIQKHLDFYESLADTDAHFFCGLLYKP